MSEQQVDKSSETVPTPVPPAHLDASQATVIELGRLQGFSVIVSPIDRRVQMVVVRHRVPDDTID